MRKTYTLCKTSLVLIISIILLLSLVGCGGNSANNNTPTKETTETSRMEPPTDTIDEEPGSIESQGKLTRNEHLNSFSMMYYLAITAEEIRTSKDNRLILNEIYTSLLNDINPGAVDEITQDHLKNLRDIIKTYLSISTKRERLQYIYNQDKAAAMRSAVPNPLAILSVTNSYDWKKLAISAVYSVVDSYNNYKSANEEADKAFLMNGWELDDEEIATVQKNRDRAFDYMVDMVQEYDLDGTLTLNEKSIEKFAEICNIESIPERTKRLESERETYFLLGSYWLELADCYFETDKYEKTLECVDKYNELATGIYRQDFNYVKILPKAIVAAQKVYVNQKEQYITKTSTYADDILDNTPKDEDNWSTRYFAAQVYMDLYAKTKDDQYLRKAYNIAYDNMAVLLQGQRDLNTAYLNEIEEIKVEDPEENSRYKYLSEEDQKKKKEAYKEEKKQAKAYNKTLKKERKTELPSLYEPLVLNCELLFALADKIGISDTEKADIEAILKTGTNGTFLTKPINDAYSFSQRSNHYTIEMKKDEIFVPADLMTARSSVKITVTDGGKENTFDDCKITRVHRKDSSIDSFKTYISSKKMKKYDWTANSKVTVAITYHDAYDKCTEYKFKVSEFKKHWYGDKVVFKAE